MDPRLVRTRRLRTEILGTPSCYATTNESKEGHTPCGPHSKFAFKYSSLKHIGEFSLLSMSGPLSLIASCNKSFSAPNRCFSLFGLTVHQVHKLWFNNSGNLGHALFCSLAFFLSISSIPFALINWIPLGSPASQLQISPWADRRMASVHSS